MDAMGDRSLIDLLDEQAAKHGHNACVVHEAQTGEVRSLTYLQLQEAARRIAARLQMQGLQKGDRGFVFLRNTPDYVPVWFGLSLAGMIFVPGNIYLTEPEIEFQLTHCDPQIVITEPMYLPLIETVCDRIAMRPLIIVTGGEGMEKALALDTMPGAPADYDRPQLGSNDIAEILYTSGTSARPKGVMLTHANLLWCGISGTAATSLQSDDRYFNNKPLFHANCQDTVLSCLTAGAVVVIGEKYSATRYLRQLIEHGITICSLSGMLCRTLLNQPRSEYDTAHKLRFAGYALNIAPEEISDFIARFRIPLRNGYGQSEAMLYITLQSPSAPSTYPSIGRPALDREVFIVDENNTIVDTGAVGELVVKGRPGRNVMLGYYNDPEATKAAFEGGWLHTGDLAFVDEKGNFYFFGRKKEVIKRAGENISSAEVEEVLINHHGVRDVAVVGIPDPIRDQAVQAFVVLHPETQITQEQLQNYCREKLAYFKVPEIILFLDELPRNASGKLNKRELIARHTNVG